MRQRKHTHCAVCGARVMARWLEVMWRWDPRAPWWWAGGWTCASCREGITEMIGSIRGVVLAVDG